MYTAVEYARDEVRGIVVAEATTLTQLHERVRQQVQADLIYHPTEAFRLGDRSIRGALLGAGHIILLLDDTSD